MDQLEIEVKFYVGDAALLRRNIVALGAESQGRFFETNIRFEDGAGSLLQKRSLLRLRRSGDTTTLTFKSEQAPDKTEFKICRELEVNVSDFGTLVQILEALGFRPEQVYEKRRETFLIEKTQLCLDEMPYGTFLEIEGSPEKIRSLAAQLGLDWKRRILMNYLGLFEIIRERQKLSFKDVTFKNFSRLEIDFAPYCHLVEAGGA